jgi:hypothetical protein
VEFVVIFALDGALYMTVKPDFVEFELQRMENSILLSMDLLMEWLLTQLKKNHCFILPLEVVPSQSAPLHAISAVSSV